MIDQDLVAYLVTLATGAGSRVYLGNAPQNVTYPCVVVRRTGGSQPRSIGGTPLFERSEFVMDALAANYDDAYSVANTIRDALKGYRATIGETVIHVSKCTLFPTDQSEIDGDKVTRRIALAFSFMHA